MQIYGLDEMCIYNRSVLCHLVDYAESLAA